MPFKKGNAFGTGRPKGSLNMLTVEARENLACVLKGEIDHIGTYIKKIKAPEKKIEAISKLLPYFLPKLSSADLQVTDVNPDVIDFTRLSPGALDEILKLYEP